MTATAARKAFATQVDGAQDVAEEGLAVFPLGTQGDEVALGHRGCATHLDEVIGIGINGVIIDGILLHFLLEECLALGMSQPLSGLFIQFL